MSPFEVMIPITLFTVIGFVIWTFLKARQAKHAMQAQIDFQHKIIDRFGNAQDFIAFIQTAEGSRYLERFAEMPTSSPMDKTLSSIRTGIIITFIGAGLLAIGGILRYPLDENGAMMFGLLALFLGAGFLVSAFASHKLAKEWGILEGKASSDGVKNAA